MRPLVLTGTAVITALALAGCGQFGKPDRADVREGLVTIYLASDSNPKQADAEFMADCMLDRVYDTAHEKTLRAWADGEEDQDEVSDNVVVLEASRACNQELADQRTAQEEREAGPLPSDEEVSAGLARVLQTQDSTLTDSEAQEIANCVHDRVGESLSDITARALAEGDNEITMDDNSSIRGATRECVEQIIPDY